MLLTEKILIRLILEELSRIQKYRKERAALDKQRVTDDSYKTYTNPKAKEKKEIQPRTTKQIETDKGTKDYWRRNADHDFFNNKVLKVFWNGAVEANWLKINSVKKALQPNANVVFGFIEWADEKFNIGALNKNEMSCVGYHKTKPSAAVLGIFGYVLDGYVTYASSGDAQSEFTSQASKEDEDFYKQSGLPKRPNIKTRIMLGEKSFVEPNEAAGGGEGMGDQRYNELLIDNSKITDVIMDLNHVYWKARENPKVRESRNQELRKIKKWCESKNFGFLDPDLNEIEVPND